MYDYYYFYCNEQITYISYIFYSIKNSLLIHEVQKSGVEQFCECECYN